jgi:uncharacterized protein YdaU (DUF1376 family)
VGLSALWWWIDRWRKSSAFMNMNLEQQGAYRNLLDEATLRGGALPNDQRILAKASGDATRWRKVKPQIMRHFELKSDGFWHNETLDKVLAESMRRAEKQRQYRVAHGNAAGNGGGNARGNGGGNRSGYPYPYPDLVPGSLERKGKGTGKGKRATPVGKRRNSVCPHTPTCATRHGCIHLSLEESRKEKAAKS